MGVVYEVIHLETARRRAMKVMHPHIFQSQGMRERFQLEARIAAEIESEFIVDVSDAGVDDATGTPFLVMELLRGEELDHRLRRMGQLPPVEVITCLHQAAMALDKTHAASIVHRDLKPENLFCTQRDDGSLRIKILDFGIAKLVAEGKPGMHTTQNMGTPLYMAPEQFHGKDLTGAVDIYALGMMAYTLLVGEPYWNAEADSSPSVVEFAMSIEAGPKEPAAQRAAAQGVILPPAFDEWFMRATASDPTERFHRASEAVQALGQALGIERMSLPPSSRSMAAQVPAPLSAPSSRVSVELGRESSRYLEFAATSTASAITQVPAERSRSLLMVVGVLMGLGVGVGAYLVLWPASRPPGNVEITVASGLATVTRAVSTPAGVSTEAPLASGPGPLAGPNVTPAPPAPSTSAVPRASAEPSAPLKTGPKPRVSGKPSVTPVTPLLGRD